MTNVARAWIVSVAAVLLLATRAPADESAEVAKAQEAAKSWLALIDAAKYGESWDGAAALFKGALPRAQWESAAKAAREPLGKLGERKLKSATFAHSLPGVPDGEYVVIQFDTRFANKAAAIETITPMHEKDGSWKVSGYYIR